MKKIYFIYNPHSGKEQIASKLNEILRTLAETDNELIVVPTIGSKDALERITYLKDGYDLVVCSGGAVQLHVLGHAGHRSDRGHFRRSRMA